MKKTKEIECWVHPFLEDNYFKPAEMISPLSCTFNGVQFLKAKIIIELPEKKIEITEGQLEEAFNGAKEQYRDVSDQLWHMKQILFKNKET